MNEYTIKGIKPNKEETYVPQNKDQYNLSVVKNITYSLMILASGLGMNEYQNDDIWHSSSNTEFTIQKHAPIPDKYQSYQMQAADNQQNIVNLIEHYYARAMELRKKENLYLFNKEFGVNFTATEAVSSPIRSIYDAMASKLAVLDLDKAFVDVDKLRPCVEFHLLFADGLYATAMMATDMKEDEIVEYTLSHKGRLLLANYVTIDNFVKNLQNHQNA